MNSDELIQEKNVTTSVIPSVYLDKQVSSRSRDGGVRLPGAVIGIDLTDGDRTQGPTYHVHVLVI